MPPRQDASPPSTPPAAPSAPAAAPTTACESVDAALQHDLGPLGRPEIGPRKASEYLWDRHDVAAELAVIEEEALRRSSGWGEGSSGRRLNINPRRLGAAAFALFVLAWAITLSVVVPRGNAAKGERAAALVPDVDKGTKFAGAPGDAVPSEAVAMGGVVVSSGASSTKKDNGPPDYPPPEDPPERPAQDAADTEPDDSGASLEPNEAGADEEGRPAQDLRPNEAAAEEEDDPPQGPDDASPPEEIAVTTESPAPTPAPAPLDPEPGAAHGAAAVSDGVDEVSINAVAASDRTDEGADAANDEPGPDVPEAQEAVQDADRPIPGAAAIDFGTLYREVGRQVIDGLAASYGDITAGVEGELLRAYPGIGGEGLEYARDALMDLLEEEEERVPEERPEGGGSGGGADSGWGADGWGADGWDDVDGAGQTRSYGGRGGYYGGGYGKQGGYKGDNSGGAQGRYGGGGYGNGGYGGGVRGGYGGYGYGGGRGSYNNPGGRRGYGGY